MKLLLTGAFGYTDLQIEYIKSLGHEVVFVQDEGKKLDFDISDIEGIVCNGLFLYNDIEQFKSLRHIQLTSAGLDRVPLDYIKQHDIRLYNAGGVYSVPMAEFAVCGVLQLYKNSKFFYENQRQRRWEKCRNLLELAGKKVLIIGAGSIGTETAKRFCAFDSRVTGVDLRCAKNPCFESILPLSELDNQLAEADIVVLTLPLTEKTKGFFNKAKFEIMKPDSVLVNIARGRLVNEADLIEALQNKKISGAVLDVFEEEPLNGNSPLWELDNVIITPHNSFVGEGNQKRLFDLIISNLRY